jgi:DNA polymerase-3 subunit beta
MVSELATTKVIVSSGVMSRFLGTLKSTVPSNPVLPILDHFRMETEGNTLIVTASDNIDFLTTRIPVESSNDELICCVPAKLLTDCLASLPEQPITLLFNLEDSQLLIRTDTGNYELPLTEAIDWPTNTDDGGFDVSLPVEQLQHALYHTAFATSTDDSKPAMGCVAIESGPSLLHFFGSDGNRLIRVERPNNGLHPFKALLPRKAADLLLNKLLKEAAGDVLIIVSPKTILFEIGPYELLTRQAEGKYPDVNGLFVQNPYELEIGKADFIGRLKTLLLFATKNTAQIRLDLALNKLTLSADNDDMKRRAKETLLASYQDDKMAIGFNGQLLLELVQHVDGALISFAFRSPYKAAFIQEQTNDDVTVTSLIMPLMLND